MLLRECGMPSHEGRIADAPGGEGNLDGLVERLALLKCEIDSVLARIDAMGRDGGGAWVRSCHAIITGAPTGKHQSDSRDCPSSAIAAAAVTEVRPATTAVDRDAATSAPASAPRSEQTAAAREDLTGHLEGFLGRFSSAGTGDWAIAEMRVVFTSLRPPSEGVQHLAHRGRVTPDTYAAAEPKPPAEPSPILPGMHIVVPLLPPAHVSMRRPALGSTRQNARSATRIAAGIAASIIAALIVIGQQKSPLSRSPLVSVRMLAGAPDRLVLRPEGLARMLSVRAWHAALRLVALSPMAAPGAASLFGQRRVWALGVWASSPFAHDLRSKFNI
jgi:hypothetical protein